MLINGQYCMVTTCDFLNLGSAEVQALLVFKLLWLSDSHRLRTGMTWQHCQRSIATKLQYVTATNNVIIIKFLCITGPSDATSRGRCILVSSQTL